MADGQDSLRVVDRPEQREDRDVGRGNFHGDQVRHIVFEGPLRLHTKKTKKRRFLPVSYTHLTLPTIYSV